MIITKHAYKRAKERFGMSAPIFEEWVAKAIEEGEIVEGLTGKKWQYIKKIKDLTKESVIYKSKILLINNGVVITCLYLPRQVITDWYNLL